jgi:hypothetical protein
MGMSGINSMPDTPDCYPADLSGFHAGMTCFEELLINGDVSNSK